MLMCQTEGGSVGCGECERYFNIKRDYCPVMCGLCDRKFLTSSFFKLFFHQRLCQHEILN